MSVTTLITGLGLLFGSMTGLARPAPAAASHTPAPASVTIAGSLQSEAGCAGDWDPACATTHLTYDAVDLVWQGSWTLPAGPYEYKAALNDSWTENYGLNAASNGANIPLNLGAPMGVKFYYDHATHWITDNVTSVIAVAAGSFQSELGCSGDWQPDCLRSWLEDADGDGIYTRTTVPIPGGSYEVKVAINESWDENYGAGGVPNGPNIGFSLAGRSTVTFSFELSTHVLTITSALAGSTADNNVEWDGLRHDSRSDTYRTPGGAQPAGTAVTLRLRTFHNDVTGVKVRLYSVEDSAQQIQPMQLAASDVGCYQPGLETESCDFWQYTVPDTWGADNIWYRFIVGDGTDTDYYGDDTAALDGGLGTTTDNPVDNSWALMLHEPDFTAPAWARDAVIYQIFPDRFRDGRANNNPETGDARYDDPVLKLPWGTKPEGYCRNYADGATNCPWRFDTTPPADSPTKEQPRGRDYFGGDLKGVDQQLDYLQALGINTIYFNPIFDAASNHAYDTQDYTKVDSYFGTQKDWENLVKHADQRGMRIILDGVFNHLSSDSPFFDRYHHYPSVGACESATSIYRSWFLFADVAPGTGTCVSSTGMANAATYTGWFGFDSIPVLVKTNSAVQDYFLDPTNGIAVRWLKAGASGWRLDVSGDSSFPDGYWEEFRGVVKAQDPDALTISETWQKDSTLLRMLRGDRLDTTMNYRLRDAVIGLLAPQSFDSKGFADSGDGLTPSEFASRLASVREDYPDAAYYSLMNLLDSHDTERLLWTLTPGSETTADKEVNGANLAAGKDRLRIASLIQFTVPGAPTVYYGDEVGMTGDDDPDDRRTLPWADLGGSPDTGLYAYYAGLADVRAALPALTDGDFQVLLANDADGTVAYGRSTDAQAVVVAINRSTQPRTLTIPMAGYVPDGIVFTARYGANASAVGSAMVSGGMLPVTLPALSARIYATGTVDLSAPSAPTNLQVVTEGSNHVHLAWNAVSGASGYEVFYSPLSGGGWISGGSTSSAALTVGSLQNGQTYYFVVRAHDVAGNVSDPSNQVSAVPHFAIGWANIQWPPTLTHVISAVNRTDTVYGQVWIDGVTNQPGPTESLRAQLGFGPDNSDPNGNPSWNWVDAVFNVDAGNNDEFKASLLPGTVGTYDYAYRYSTTAGREWVYADLDGIGNGYSSAQAGSLTVNPSGDVTAPAVPTGLHVVGASPVGVELAWDAVMGDPSLYGYEVGRAATSGGPYTLLATVTGTTSFTDTQVEENATYWYVVRAVDLSFNRSAWSGEMEATAALRTVTLTVNVTVPSTTDATGRSVYIAGYLDRLDGNLPQWDPAGVVLTRIDATHWTITFTGDETTQIEYKYTLGSWDYVEKEAACGEIANRQLTLDYGTTGIQTVNDTVLNWRNIAPCTN